MVHVPPTLGRSSPFQAPELRLWKPSWVWSPERSAAEMKCYAHHDEGGSFLNKMPWSVPPTPNLRMRLAGFPHPAGPGDSPAPKGQGLLPPPASQEVKPPAHRPLLRSTPQSGLSPRPNRCPLPPSSGRLGLPPGLPLGLLPASPGPGPLEGAALFPGRAGWTVTSRRPLLVGVVGGSLLLKPGLRGALAVTESAAPWGLRPAGGVRASGPG